MVFEVRRLLWTIEFVSPSSKYLIDRTYRLRLATTDPMTHTIYIADNMSISMTNRVLVHELAHVIMFSYDLLPKIHSVVPRDRWIDAEEWVCNFIADYGYEIFSIAYNIMGENAWFYLPSKLERLVS